MNIVSITMVKNESDIIESFVRYTINFVDKMIILDNFSTDETPLILNNLINEGLPIVVIPDEDDSYAQDAKTTKLLNTAINEYDADMVCILDCDEFISSDNGQNPRKILEKLDMSYYHLIKRINYIPSPHDDYNINFIPKRITQRCEEDMDLSEKVIVPKNIVKNNKNVQVKMGNHDLLFNGKKKTNLSNIINQIYIAHYPIRSKEQCMSKILVGWPNIIAAYSMKTVYATHWKELFNKIKEYNTISLEDIESFTKILTTFDDPDSITTITKPINLDFCENIDMKYIYPVNYLRNILENSINLANDVSDLKKELNLKTGKTSFITGIKMKLIDLIL